MITPEEVQSIIETHFSRSSLPEFLRACLNNAVTSSFEMTYDDRHLTELSAADIVSIVAENWAITFRSFEEVRPRNVVFRGVKVDFSDQEWAEMSSIVRSFGL